MPKGSGSYNSLIGSNAGNDEFGLGWMECLLADRLYVLSHRKGYRAKVSDLGGVGVRIPYSGRKSTSRGFSRLKTNRRQRERKADT